jgi:hypothetical protein
MPAAATRPLEQPLLGGKIDGIGYLHDLIIAMAAPAVQRRLVGGESLQTFQAHDKEIAA